MQDDTVAFAIDAALKCNWETAIRANTKILKTHPVDIDCLNRLGKAYLETGDTKKAALFFRKVLKLDKYNPIATKNLARAGSTKQAKRPPAAGAPNTAANFLEEPGKTRLATLVNVAPPSTLLKQDHADALVLVPKKHTVLIEDSEGNYLGALPDDLGHRLSVLMKGGNRYEAITKSVSKNAITIFLRETYRANKFHNTPSFPTASSADYLSFLREDTTATDETKAAITADLEDEDTPGHDLHQDEEPETT